MKHRGILVTVFALAAIAGVVTSLYINRPQANKEVAYIEPERTFHYPLSLVKRFKNASNPGKAVYEEYCAACHAPQPEIPLNAPRMGNKKEWAAYRKLGIDNLLKIAAQGAGAMPARGGCFECDDQLLKQAIQYILDNS